MASPEGDRLTNPQCIHIPDGSVVVSGELFDMACAAIAERDKLLADITRTLEERDRADDYADQLAEMIGVFCEVEIGEHSNENCPWENAIEAMRVAIGNKVSADEPRVGVIDDSPYNLLAGLRVELAWHVNNQRESEKSHQRKDAEIERLKDGLARIKETSPGDSPAWTLAYEALNNRPYSIKGCTHETSIPEHVHSWDGDQCHYCHIPRNFWECECEAPDNFRHELTEWCADCGKNRPTERT